jgi:biotin carboxylase
MAIFPKAYVVLVGAFSTGRFLPYLFKGLGYDCIHVNAHTHMPERYTAGYSENKFLYIEDIQFNGDVEACALTLKKYPIACIIPGTESGVWLADALNEKLGIVERNDMSLSAARRDKYLMQKALKEKGLAHIPSYVVEDEKTLLQTAHQIGFPVVLKPLASSDAEGMYFCYNAEELQNAFSHSIGKQDLYNQSMNQLLLQKKMEGREYVVNTVSWEGRHFITDIWTNDKRKNGLMYDYQDLIDPGVGVGAEISSYIRSVSDAVGIRYGAGHSELIYTDSGPVLIEIGARLHGDFAPSSLMDVFGYNQLSVLAQSYLHPISCHSYFDDLEARKEKKKCKIVSMISNCTGTIQDMDPVNFFYGLKSFFAMQHSMRPEKKLYQTIDLRTSPGNIFLVSENQEQLESDYIAIRKYEQRFYRDLVGDRQEEEKTLDWTFQDQEHIFHH